MKIHHLLNKKDDELADNLGMVLGVLTLFLVAGYICFFVQSHPGTLSVTDDHPMEHQ